MRDVLAGEDAVKAAGEDYLPRLGSAEGTSVPEKNREYEAYKARAQFFGATGRTRETLTGFIFRKDPTVTIPDKLAEFMQDCTMDGRTFYDVTKHVVTQVLSVGRCGTLVDFDAEDERRPYLCNYDTEDVWNWRVERVGAEMVLTLLVLHEMSPERYDLAPTLPATAAAVQTDPAAPAVVGSNVVDEFEETLTPQWRVFRLMRDDAAAPFVQCSLYRKSTVAAGETGFVEVQQTIPTRRGVALTRIPFVFHGVAGSEPEPEQPPLEDLALVNLSLYRTSADLENGRHVCGIPTPWAAGFTDEENKKELVMGTTVAWSTAKSDAKCGFLEFEGQGLNALEKAVEQKTTQMAALGAKMLEPEAKKAEAFDTVAVRSAAESSALANITVANTQSLSRVLRWAAWWMGTEATPEDIGENAQTELNTEFTVTSLPADQIMALLSLWQASAIDQETLFYKLQQGEIIAPGTDLETMRTNIEANPPAMPGGLPPVDPNQPPPGE